MGDRTVTTCPKHGALEGLGTYCHDCGEYADVLWAASSTTDPTPPVRDALPDTRPESEIRMAIRSALGQLGWTVWDFEQGYRPDRCECGQKIPGGTRVPRGIADLYVMGYGCSAWLEVKSPKGRQTEHQRDREAECVAAGVAYHVVRSEKAAVEIMEGHKARRAA